MLWSQHPYQALRFGIKAITWMSHGWISCVAGRRQYQSYSRQARSSWIGWFRCSLGLWERLEVFRITAARSYQMCLSINMCINILSYWNYLFVHEFVYSNFLSYQYLNLHVYIYICRWGHFINFIAFLESRRRGTVGTTQKLIPLV